ncbi:hypothetical protein [Lysobacter sp. Hz 25]|uniref:hypothetical protein n=1 Tax=Lysobacter sp. Hz 25 TaxID=3383698 RepID=UPI0038D5173B
MNRQAQIFATCFGWALAAASVAQAAPGDRQVYDEAIARASRVCPDHSPERTGPGIRSIPVAALRVIEQRNYTLCPDRRLDSQTPVVWYGREGVFAWNPGARGAVKLLAGKAAAYAKDKSFPSQTVVWKPNGKLAEGALVPAFRGRLVR